MKKKKNWPILINFDPYIHCILPILVIFPILEPKNQCFFSSSSPLLRLPKWSLFCNTFFEFASYLTMKANTHPIYACISLVIVASVTSHVDSTGRERDRERSERRKKRTRKKEILKKDEDDDDDDDDDDVCDCFQTPYIP